MTGTKLDIFCNLCSHFVKLSVSEGLLFKCWKWKKAMAILTQQINEVKTAVLCSYSNKSEFKQNIQLCYLLIDFPLGLIKCLES